MSDEIPPLLPIRNKRGQFSGDLPDEVARDVARRLQAGESYREISAALGLRRSTGPQKCAQVARALGLPVEPTYEERVEAFRADVARMAEAGQTNADIARATKRSQQHVAQVRRNMGLGYFNRLSISVEEDAEIKRRLIAGETTHAVARAVGCEQADVHRRRKLIAHLIPAELPPCQCGRPARHKGYCRLPQSKIDWLKQQIIDGRFIETLAPELGMSAQHIRDTYGRAIFAELADAGIKCVCGQPIGHARSCSVTAAARRHVFSQEQRDTARSMSFDGKAIPEIMQAVSLGEHSTRRLCQEVRNAMASEGIMCGCGRPINHQRSCSARAPVKKLIGYGKTALAMGLNLRRRIAGLAKAGKPIKVICDRTGQSPWKVTEVIKDLAAANALPEQCGDCPKPYLHKAPCKKPERCACGRWRYHRGPCRTAKRDYPLLRDTNPDLYKALFAKFQRGVSGRRMSRDHSIRLATMQDMIRHWRENPRYNISPKFCACGRPARHPGGCVKNTPLALGKRLKGRIEADIRAGSLPHQVAERYGIHPLTALKLAAPIRDALFAEGVTCACGRPVGHRYWCSHKWDEYGKPRGRRPYAEPTESQAVKALVEGDSVADIASRLGVAASGLYRLRKYLPQEQRDQRAKAIRRRLSLGGEAQGVEIMAVVRAAVPATISGPVRDDIEAELYLAVMEGRIEVAQVRNVARSFVNRGFAEWESKYGPKSLDQPLAEGGSMALRDLIEDQTTTEQLDELSIGETEA